MNALRKLTLTANWKMYKNTAEAADFLQDLRLSAGHQTDVHIVVCPPFTALETAGKILEGTHIQLGAQNMHQEASGAFTGEISAEMLRHLFVRYVIIGHSERRQLYAETYASVAQKMRAALKAKLKPILCIGETAQQRQAHQTISVLTEQLQTGLAGIDEKSAEGLVIAYEPVWAIGTGVSATNDVIQETHAAIRALIAAIISPQAAMRTRILYGGSLKPENAQQILSQADVDGGLVGSASLELRNFLKLIEIAQNVQNG